MDQTARVDGYGIGAFFRRILVPQIAPGVAVAAFFGFMFSGIEFLMANAMTTVNVKPITGIMSRAGGVMVWDFALLAAASVLGLVPGAVLMVLMRNDPAQGFSMGRLRSGALPRALPLGRARGAGGPPWTPGALCSLCGGRCRARRDA